MVDIARVNLYGQTVGFVRWDNNLKTALFEYADSFVGSGLEPSPILMPARRGRIYSFSDIGRETFKGLPGLLADSLPDTQRVCSFLGKSNKGRSSLHVRLRDVFWQNNG